MASETTVRCWFLVIRRPGHAVKKVRVNIYPAQDGADLDRLVDPVPVSPDFEVIDIVSGLSTDTRVASYELISTTQAFEIINYD